MILSSDERMGWMKVKSKNLWIAAYTIACPCML